MGCFMVPAVISAEATLPDYKIYTTMCSGLGFVIGELIFAVEAFCIRDWIPLQLVAYTPMLILLVLYFVFPESTRWLIAKGKIEKAKAAISLRASVNSLAPVPEELYEVTDQGLVLSQKSETPPTIKDLFKPKVILLRILNMFLQWFSVTMGYYGLLFASTGLGGDPHKTFALAVLAELPALFIYLKLPQWFGRKVVLIGCQLICGICCIVAGLLVPYPSRVTIKLILVMIGRLSAALGFGMVYLYTSELFPTTIRSTAIGTCSCMARVGGILALLMNGNLNFWPPLTFVIFGAVATLAGILAFSFPETTNDKLPETMEEAMNLGKNITRSKLGIIQKA